MVLYDGFINRLSELVKDKKELPRSTKELQNGSKNDIIFGRDTAFEFGGSQKPCVSTLAVSSDMHFSNKAYLVGRDLPQITGDSPFGKIVLVEIDEQTDDDTAFNTVKELEQVKYKFYVRDFMTRASALNMREQIRVGKNAVKSGVSFADYGQKLIDTFLQNEKVKSVEVVFLTDFDGYKELNSVAEKIKETTSALNHILDNVMFDCSTCNLKPICDEVEGMKELHQKHK
ncbi:hypothetical protein [uncultured Eubacterium sp.]|uniref:hypothetical protein n=1 Tax=uncultured Eubacterium sp. TaxID=165185 RepID=UPI0025E8C56D|nr:hypothetical protein [uncultured Eubacterium sp.]